MQRWIIASVACAITLAMGAPAPIARAQAVTAPVVRIGGDARGLQPVQVRTVGDALDRAGPALRRTLTFVLRNPNARVLEGTFEFPLAAGEQVAGFALDIDGRMRDAVPVPKARAREVFEAIERRGVDPGLVEQTAGNHFRVRVYPIPAQGERRVRLVLDRTDARYTAAAASAWQATLADGTTWVLGERRVAHQARARAIPKRVGLLWDASGSAQARDRRQVDALLDRYFEAMGEGRVTLRVLRDVGEDGGTFEIRRGDWSALRAKLDATVDDGATDLADWTPRTDIDEYLLVSDGLRTYGEAEVPRLGANQRLYAIATNTIGGDPTRLAVLAQQRNGRLVNASGRGLLFDDGPRIVGLAPHGVTELEVPGRFADAGVLRVAGRVTQPGAYVDVTLDDGGGQHVVRVDLPNSGPSHPQVAGAWAGWKLRALSVAPERNAAQIAHIGQQFGIVTAGTSLLVLETADDYAQHDIAAPPELRAEVARLRAETVASEKQQQRDRLDTVASRFAQRVEWWNRKFPKGAPPIEHTTVFTSGQNAAGARREAAPAAYAPPPAPAAVAAAEARAESDTAAAAKSLDAVEGTDAPATITLQPWQPDSPYARRLRSAKPGEVYARYLEARDTHADSSAFHLDAADVLLEKGRRAEALRVLSNLAEMRLESRHVLRVLGYRLMQAKEPARAVEVFRKVLAMADEEPQSHRDLGLALAAVGQRQEAIEHLYTVVARPWDGRFDEVELVALNELNAIVATSPQPLDTAFIDRRLLRNLPVDLRAVLAWDSDNSDMDLWVTDPNGERCYYGNRLTYQGGQLSDDFTGGYGPEEFLLRDAKPGKYRVEANFFGDRQQIVTGATTLTLTLSTGWGTARRRDQAVTLRLNDAKETVLVGEFEVE